MVGKSALILIAGFWLATILSELSGRVPFIVAVKTAIPWGLLLLVPALAAVGGSGLALSQGRRDGLTGIKLARMPWIAANGILVPIPSALFLAWKAGHCRLDAAFHAVQVLELTAGALNVTPLARNMRDGLRMTGRLRRG